MADSAREPVIVWTLDGASECEWHVDTPDTITGCAQPAVWRAEVAGINGEWDVCAEHLAAAAIDLVTPAL